MSDLVLRDMSDGILRLTLNDPATRNSLSEKMIEDAARRHQRGRGARHHSFSPWPGFQFRA